MHHQKNSDSATENLENDTLEILKKFTGLPFEEYIDKEKNRHAVIITDGVNLDLTILLKTRFCFGIDFVTRDDAKKIDVIVEEKSNYKKVTHIHKLFENMHEQPVNGKVCLVIPCINKLEEEMEEIPDYLDSDAELMPEPAYNILGNAGRIMALTKSEEARNQFFIDEHKRIRQKIKSEIKEFEKQICRFKPTRPITDLKQNFSKLQIKFDKIFGFYKILEVIDSIYSHDISDTKIISGVVLIVYQNFIQYLVRQFHIKFNEINFVARASSRIYLLILEYLTFMDILKFKSVLCESPLFLCLFLESAYIVSAQEVQLNITLVEKMLTLAEKFILDSQGCLISKMSDATDPIALLPVLIFKNFVIIQQFDKAYALFKQMFIVKQKKSSNKLKVLELVKCFYEIVSMFRGLIKKSDCVKEIKPDLAKIYSLFRSDFLQTSEVLTKKYSIDSKIEFFPMLLQELHTLLSEIEATPENPKNLSKKKKKHKKKAKSLMKPAETKRQPEKTENKLTLSNPNPFVVTPFEISKHEPTPRIESKLIDQNEHEKLKKYLQKRDNKSAKASEEKSCVFYLQYQHSIIKAKLAACLRQDLAPGLAQSILSIMAKKKDDPKKLAAKLINAKIRKSFRLPASITHTVTFDLPQVSEKSNKCSLFAQLKKENGEDCLIFTKSSLQN